MERCEKCGSQKILKNDVPECIFCIGKKQGVAKPGYITVKDPGEKGIRKLLEEHQVPVLGKTIGTGSPAISVSTNVQSALNIMQNLSMPDDLKQFKQIKKIISQLEKLIEVQNNGTRSIRSK